MTDRRPAPPAETPRALPGWLAEQMKSPAFRAAFERAGALDDIALAYESDPDEEGAFGRALRAAYAAGIAAALRPQGGEVCWRNKECGHRAEDHGRGGCRVRDCLCTLWPADCAPPAAGENGGAP